MLRAWPAGPTDWLWWSARRDNLQPSKAVVASCPQAFLTAGHGAFGWGGTAHTNPADWQVHDVVPPSPFDPSVFFLQEYAGRNQLLMNGSVRWRSTDDLTLADIFWQTHSYYEMKGSIFVVRPE